MCRYPNKRLFRTREVAREGMRAIRFEKGHGYNTLYPFRCPDEAHWHLTSRKQGRATCPACENQVPAWWYADGWIIGYHGDCTGEGYSAA